MRKFSAKFASCLSFLLVVVVSNVNGEPPSSPYGRIALKHPPQTSQSESKIVDQRLLDRVADILSDDGDGSENNNTPQENEGLSIVDSELFERIARIISQNEGQTSPVAPVPQGPAITSDYGVPPEVGSRLLGGSFEIGKPVAARRIAYFQLTDDNSLGSGYGSPPQMRSHTPSNAYGPSAPPSGKSRIMFISDPRLSERIAAFAIPDSAPPLVRGRGYGPNSK